jgi:hypothetical protein
MSSPELVGPGESSAGTRSGTQQASVPLRDWTWITLLGLFLIALSVLLISLLIALWPEMVAAIEATPTKKTGEATANFSWFGHEWALSADAALLFAVVLVSALGSFVHAATSFIDYVGNRQLRLSWIWWYILRALVGSSLALLFYFAIRGGFFTGTSTEDINPYGIAAVAGLVGLFSKQATDKLRELFDTAFRVGQGYGDDARKDSITNPAPVLQGTEPAELVTGGELEIDLQGEGFIPESVVRVRRLDADATTAVPRKTQYLGPSRLRVLLQPDDIGASGMLELSVVNPEPGGGASGVLRLAVGPALADAAELTKTSGTQTTGEQD